MTAPSNLVSLRITEEDMMMLDARVGLEGARNRSDVIRQAIQQFLNGQPLVQGMDSVRIPLGHGDVGATRPHEGAIAARRCVADRPGA